MLAGSRKESLIWVSGPLVIVHTEVSFEHRPCGIANAAYMILAPRDYILYRSMGGSAVIAAAGHANKYRWYYLNGITKLKEAHIHFSMV